MPVRYRYARKTNARRNAETLGKHSALPHRRGGLRRSSSHEHGVTVRQGPGALRQALPSILAQRTDVLSPRIIHLIEDLTDDWRRFDQRIADITREVEDLAKQDEHCKGLMAVPGIGPMTASAMAAAIGDGAAFSKGRDFAAWLGLVPKQISTGDRTILGGISRRGNRYLRTLFIQGARSVLQRSDGWEKKSFGGNWSVELSLTMDLVIGPIATASILRVENCVMRGPPALPHPGKSAETV